MSFIVLSGQLIQDGGEHGKTSGFHDCEHIIALLWIRHSVSPQMVVLAEALCAGMANL